MSIRETFSNTISLLVTNEYDKGAVMKISKRLGTFTILLVEASSETGLFRNLSHYVFGVLNLDNKKCIRDIFFSKFLNFNLDFKNAAKN